MRMMVERRNGLGRLEMVEKGEVVRRREDGCMEEDGRKEES
jgi:hypothetical protein